MSASALQPMQAKRVFDAGERYAFGGLAGAQVYGQELTLLGEPAGLLVPYLKDGAWWITPGYVEGTLIDGSGAALPVLGAGMKVYAVCTVVREFAILEGQNGGGDFFYLTGRYTLTPRLYAGSTGLSAYEASTQSITTSKLLFTCDAEGNPPAALTGKPHYHINGTSLTF